MSHKHNNKSHHNKISKSREWIKFHQDSIQNSSDGRTKPKLEFVLKCDSAGSVEEVTAGILEMAHPEVDICITHSGIGDVNHSDILMAETGSRLIAGFKVDLLQGIEKDLYEHIVEVCLYNEIYKLTADIANIAVNMVPSVSEEEITGTARIIARSKSIRKRIVAGCEVLEGHLAPGKRFRIISAMGPVYSGVIESMHMDKNTVQKAIPGQQVDIKITNFNKVKIGDLIESFRSLPFKKSPVWQPRGEVIRKTGDS